MNPAIEFIDVKIGRLFRLNGCDYIKMSSRTGRMLSNGRTFYMKKYERVHTIAN